MNVKVQTPFNRIQTSISLTTSLSSSSPLPSFPEFQFSLDLPSTLSFEGTHFDPSELSMLGSPPFGGDAMTTTTGPSHSTQSFGRSSSSPHRPGVPPSKPPPPPPPFDPPAGSSLFDLNPSSSSSGMQVPPTTQGSSLFDPSERNFLSSFLEGFQDFEFDPSLPKDMPSFKDASLRAGISENSNSPNSQGFRGGKSSNFRRNPSNGSGSGSGWSPHNGNPTGPSSGQTPPTLGINTSTRSNVDSQRASAAFGGLSGWDDVDEEDVSTTPTGSNAENEGEVGRKRSASTANRNNHQPNTPESVMSNDTNDSRGHSAYNAFIISYAPPPNQQQQHPSSFPNLQHRSSPSHQQQNQQPFRPLPPSYMSRIPMQNRPPPPPQQQQSHPNPYQHLQSLQSQSYPNVNHNGPGMDLMNNAGKKIKTGHNTSASPVQRSNASGTSSQSPNPNDHRSRNNSTNGNNTYNSSFSAIKPSNSNSTSSTATAPPRQLLTDSEKRQNHILSEQRRRNFIREGFKELVELLEAGRGFGARGLGLSSGDGTGVEDEGLDDRSEVSDNEDGSGIALNSKKKKKSKRATPAGRRGRGKGRGRGGSAGGGGGSKSAVLFQAVDLIRWLEVKNSELEKSCEEIEKFNGSIGGGEELMQE